MSGAAATDTALTGSEVGPGAPLAASGAPWLVSARWDFWLASAGGASLLLGRTLVLRWHGARELDLADLLLSELHVGATYDVIVRRRLWRRMPLDVLAMPLAILGAAYALAWHGGAVLLTTAILYLGAWHRGRQSLGIARHYQRQAGGPVSVWHRRLLSAAFYLPMAATVAYYTSAAPDHEGEAFHRLALGPETVWGLGGLASACVVAYLAWTRGRTAGVWTESPPGSGAPPARVHPGERSLVLANAAAFASAYVLGAGAASFVLVLAVYHEVQYLYFTYATGRRAEVPGAPGLAGAAGRLARFSVWPVVGLASWGACTYSGAAALRPFLTAGLLSHYWLDGRIWTARARRLAPLGRRAR